MGTGGSKVAQSIKDEPSFSSPGGRFSMGDKVVMLGSEDTGPRVGVVDGASASGPEISVCVSGSRMRCSNLDLRPHVPVSHRGITLRQLRQLHAEAEALCVAAKQVNEVAPSPAWERPERRDATGKLWPAVRLDASATVGESAINLHDLMTHLVKPVTQKKQCSYVEHVAGGKEQPPRWFVSHSWATPIRQHLYCLEQHASDRGLSIDESPYWVCAYANNQWELETELSLDDGDLCETPFHQAMKLAATNGGGTVAVIDTEANYFTRSAPTADRTQDLRSPCPRLP